MRRNFIFCQFIVIFVILFSFSIAGAQSTGLENEDSLQRFTDDLGRELEISLPINSVISLAASNTEILCAIGLCSNLVGVDLYSNFPAETEEIEKVTNMDMSLNLEMILTLNPDLVLVSELTPTDQIYSMEELGIPVFYLANPDTLDELPAHIEKVGKITGHMDEAQEVALQLEKRIAAVDEMISVIKEEPTVFYELDATDPMKPWTASTGTFIDDLITRSGGKNIAADLTAEYAQISQEILLLKDPDIIILGDSNFGITAESVANRPGWDEMKAVKNNKVIEFNDDLGARPGPRLVDGLEQIAAILHPELFEK
ncbi:MAG: ABC transporter substrate-binding protein [Flexilinea sp.]